MNTTLSVYFGSERTYAALLSQAKQGKEVLHVGVYPIVLKEETDIPLIAEEIKKDFASFHGMVHVINYSIPIEKVFIYQLPAVDPSQKDAIRAMLDDEIQKVEPEKKQNDYAIMVLPGNSSQEDEQHMLAVLTDKSYLSMCEKALSGFKAPIKFTQNSQFAAHSAFIHNYPEYVGKTVAILGVQERFIDVSVINEGNLAFYSLYGIADDEDFGSVCAKIFTSILPQYLPKPDLALFFGEGLSKDLLDPLAISLTVPVMRLNAFRMLLSGETLSVGELQLCSKAAHLFPPVIGASLPALQAKEIMNL